MTRPGKPAGLVTRAETKAKKELRAQKEDALRPKRFLPSSPPARLKDYEVACFVWRKLMRRFYELEAEIVTGLDWILVENYCLSMQELDDLMTMRKVAYELWLVLAKKHKELLGEEKHDDAIFVATQVVGAYDAIFKADARIDRKKDLIQKLGMTMYVTPRARAGTAPSKKEKEEPPDEMERLLDDVNDFVNGDQRHAG